MQKLWASEGLGPIEKKSRIKQQTSLPSNNAHPINKHSKIDTCQKNYLITKHAHSQTDHKH
jgi:hypothetical protein